MAMSLRFRALSGRFESFFLLLLQAGITRASKLVLELFDAAGGIYEFQLPGVERVANAANIDLHFRNRAAGIKGVAATAANNRGNVLGVNAFFHDRPVLAFLACGQLSPAP